MNTILTMSSLGIDICVIRHSMEDYYKELIDSRTIQTAIVKWWRWFWSTPKSVFAGLDDDL